MKKLKLVAIGVITLVVVIVVLQNTQAVETKLLFVTLTLPNAALLFGTLSSVLRSAYHPGHIVSSTRNGLCWIKKLPHEIAVVERDYTRSLKGTQMSTTSDRLGTHGDRSSQRPEGNGWHRKKCRPRERGPSASNANEYYQQRRDQVNSTLCTFEQYVRERPVKSVLVAAGIGLLFGRFWMRR